MASPAIIFVLPTYNKFAYARLAVFSFFKYSPPDSHCVVVDDASPFFPYQDWNAWLDGLPQGRVTLQHFETNAGLTRGWNWGLDYARRLGAEYAIAGNSDIIFTPEWAPPLLYHLAGRYHLVGPVTNAPGPTNRGQQSVRHYYPGYKVTDDPAYLASVAEHLRRTRPIHEIVPCAINGFFTMARTESWWEGAFDAQHVFNPAKRMTGNEDELQQRWQASGRRVGFVPSSFIFHYRAVSRGKRYRHTGWHRPVDPR